MSLVKAVRPLAKAEWVWLKRVQNLKAVRMDEAYMRRYRDPRLRVRLAPLKWLKAKE